jgi:hypothetical protein
MKRVVIRYLSLAAILLACKTVTAEPQPLFNGRDLENWVVMHGGEWTVEEGVLVGRNGTNWSTNPEKSGSWLRTAKQYKDFVLELEYSISPRGNSGVFIRSDTEKNPAFTGYEMQIADDAGRQPTKGSSGALYAVVAASRNMSKPVGEWNSARIEARGSTIKVWLNGEKIVEHQGDRRDSGYIGLQNHDNRTTVKFRKLRITPVTPE